MDKDKDDNVHQLPNKKKLWHERLEGSEITKQAIEVIQSFLSKGVKVNKINVFWDDDGKFIAQTTGAYLKRRVEDRKEPEDH